MSRDEILDAIKSAADLDPADTGLDEVYTSMRSVVALADAYMENGTGDVQYLAEAMRDAVGNLADTLQRFTYP